MNTLKTISFAIVPTTAWIAAATATGAPLTITAPGGLLLIALASGINTLITSSEGDPA